MRYSSKKDLLIILIIWKVILVSVVALMDAILQEKHLIVLIILPPIGFLLWLYYATYYEFRDTYLYVRSGPFVERIPYEKIVEIKKVRNYLSSMALSSDRILIRKKRKSFAGLTYISPEKRDQFYEELLQRCDSSSKVNKGCQLGPKR